MRYRKLKLLKCSTCYEYFIRYSNKVKDSKKRYGDRPLFCSRACFNNFQDHIVRPYHYCKWCGIRFTTHSKKYDSENIGLTCSLKCRKMFETNTDLDRIAWNKGMTEPEWLTKDKRKSWEKQNNPRLQKYRTDYYFKNRQHKHDYDQNYFRKNPEKYLERNKRQLVKHSIPFKIPYMKYMLALTAWSKSIKKIFGGVCLVCGSNESIQTHHLFHKAGYPELSLNLNNGIPLCLVHHNEVHMKNIRVNH